MRRDVLRAGIRVIEFMSRRQAVAASAARHPGQPGAWAIRARFADGSSGDYLLRIDSPHPYAVRPACFPSWPPPNTYPVTIYVAIP